MEDGPPVTHLNKKVDQSIISQKKYNLPDTFDFGRGEWVVKHQT